MKLEPCVPPLWAASGHTQTILGHILPSPRLRSKGKRVEIAVSGGDRLIGFVQEGTSNTIVYVFHGLAGSTDSAYMHRTSMLAQKMGHGVILLNHRGCGEGAGLASGPYHSGRAEDLSAAIGFGRSQFRRHRHVAVGFSISGNALLLLQSGRRGETKPDAAIAFNAPIHLERCSKLLSRGFNRLYDAKFYRQCRRDALRNSENTFLKGSLPRFSTIYEFDRHFTAPAGGFADREEYYATCSTLELLREISTPTMVVTAKDDPFVPYDSYATAQFSNAVRFHAEEFGGHMGYISRAKTPLGTRRWQDYAVSEALRSI